MTDPSEKRVLVVDDEPDVRNFISACIEDAGFNVETAENGLEALEILKKKRVEVIISDLMMPKMTGIELLREVRKHYPMTHVIVITGYVTMDNLLSTLRLGADTCIFKPIHDMSELESAVESAIEDLNKWQDKLRQLMGMKQ